MILALGFRVRSIRGTQFRQWANCHLHEYMVKGFVMDDERLKNPEGRPDYFDEMLARIRDIRASEKRFYQKVRDLFALCSDYDPSDKATQMVFAETQNKLLFAVSGRTAAKIVTDRADATNLFALTSGGCFKDEGKNLSFDSGYANFGSVQDAGNWSCDGVSHSLELRDGTLTRINNANEDDFQSYTVGNGCQGVGDAVELDGVWQVPLVKNLGSGTNRVDLVNQINGSIIPTDLLFTHAYDITGMGNTQATRLEDLIFFFTDANKKILEANTTLGVVEVYEINGFAGNGDYTDVCFDGEDLYVSTDFAQVLGYVGFVEGFTPADPDPAHTEDGVAIAWLRENGIDTDFEAAGALDPDHDGFTTAQEDIADTCPTNSADYFHLSIEASRPGFYAASNRLYEVEYSDNLTSNGWNLLTNNLPGSGNHRPRNRQQSLLSGEGADGGVMNAEFRMLNKEYRISRGQRCDQEGRLEACGTYCRVVLLL